MPLHSSRYVPPLWVMSRSAAGTPFTRHTSSVGYWVVPSVFTFASSSTSDARVGPSTGTQTEVSAASCSRAPESTMTWTPSHGPDAAPVSAAAEEAGAEVAGGLLAAGVEQAARENMRPAAARELAAAVRIVVNGT